MRKYRQRNLYPDLDCRVLDVTRQEQITATLNALTHLDVLINCAGVILRNNQEHTPKVLKKHSILT